MNDTTISVSELNNSVKTLLETGMGYVFVEGEISNLARPASGHLYFSLKDDKSQVRCAFFRGFTQGKAHAWENGMQVIARARVTLYAPRGDYQLVVEQLQEAGVGALQQAFEALKAKLEKEGLFKTEHKKALPEFPQHIGVVTSPTGAAIQDILHTVERRYPLAQVTIYPTLVQGAQAAAQIVKAIKLAEKHGEADVLIVGRGGGSLEDLWPFNEEAVARAIYACKLPVISAVGHETDFTIADFVADVRAPTPTAAAEMASPDGDGLLGYIQQQTLKLIREMQQHLHAKEQLLHHLSKRLVHPGQKLQHMAQRLDDLWLRMEAAMKQSLMRKQAKFLELTRALEALSPLAVLNRGYSITFDAQGKPLHSIEKIKPGDLLTTELSDGQIKSQVIS